MNKTEQNTKQLLMPSNATVVFLKGSHSELYHYKIGSETIKTPMLKPLSHIDSCEFTTAMLSNCKIQKTDKYCPISQSILDVFHLPLSTVISQLLFVLQLLSYYTFNTWKNKNNKLNSPSYNLPVAKAHQLYLHLSVFCQS